jgi:uncharacterized membrane protein (DUF373 family)
LRAPRADAQAGDEAMSSPEARQAREHREERMRTWIARAFTAVEDVVYVGLGLLLAGSAIALLISGAIDLVQTIAAGSFANAVIGLLDHILLILLVVELLYTVQVSFREHAVVPEPFLLVGMIAVIRRVLVLTAEFGEGRQHSEDVYRHFFIELSVLTVLIVAITVSLVLLRKTGQVTARRA